MVKQVKTKQFRKFGLVPKCTKRKIKSCWTKPCSLKRSLVRLSDQVLVALWARLLDARLGLAQANSVQNQHSRSLRASLTACSSELCPESTGHARLELADGSLKRTLISSGKKKLWISKPFFPNTPILIFPHPKRVPNNVYRSYAWKHTQRCIKLEIKTSFHQNSTIHQTFTTFQQQQQFSSSIHQIAYSLYQFINNMFQNNINNK